MKKLFAVALTLLAALAGARAETYPSKPITLIVPFAAGGITDIVARNVAERMRTALGQPIIIENVGGAGGTLGVTRLFRSAPDGYTIAIGQWTSHVGAGAMYHLPYDYEADFEPISLLSAGPLWVIGRKDLPPNNIKELVAWLKANPDKGAAGTIGVGSGIHMCLVYFQNQTGTKFPLIPYRGAAPVMQDMMGGQIDLSCPEAGQTLPQFRAGSIKAFGVLTRKRWFAAPDVPTMIESGFPDLEFPFWHGLWAPKGTPKEIIDKLDAAVVETLADPAVRKRFTDLGHEVVPRDQQTPDALRVLLKAEIAKWFPIMRDAGVKQQ